MITESAKPIGGYFEWEFPKKIYPILHEDEGFLVNNARSALQLILQSIGNVKKVYVPYYTCDSITAALEAIGIPYEQYHIDNNLHIEKSIYPKAGEYIIYTNYFGIMDSYCRKLAASYGDSFIIDNAQALYAPHIEGTHSIYSCRKYVGVPDGGIAISDSISTIEHLPISQTKNRCGALLARAEGDVAGGHKLFKENDHQFREDGIQRMSLITKKILQSINHEEIIKRRKENFLYLHANLKDINKLSIPNMESFACPLVYPFYTDDSGLRKRLIDNKIFVAQYWPNVLEWCEEKTIEYNLMTHIMALPIDQRYDEEDMSRIIKILAV